jgi:hypothetical protein
LNDVLAGGASLIFYNFEVIPGVLRLLSLKLQRKSCSGLPRSFT